jgi:hypothetical protein
MKKRHAVLRWSWVCWVGLVSGGGVEGAPITLVDAGHSPYRLVVSADAIPAERQAAEEFQRYIEQITGVRIAVVTDLAKPQPRDVLLGFNRHASLLGGLGGAEELGTDGFVWRTVGRRLVIAGGRPRGTLNGVYTFLEEELGVRWFAPDAEHVPRRTRVQVRALDRRVVPVFEYREVFWTEMMRDGDFAARHRLNGPHHRLMDRHGGPAVIYQPFVHSFDALIPPALYASHPEYFPLIDGQRKDGYVQRCLTHPEVLRLSIERVRQWIREHPEANIISVSQNDTFNYCQCDGCRAVDEAEGGPSGSLVRFVNAIAEAIETDHPRVRIDTLAYQYTRRPPLQLRPRPNVIVRLCSIECCFAHPLASCPSKVNTRFREDVEAWQPVAPRLYVWDYTPNFAHYLQIFPNFDVLQENVQFFARHGVRGLFEQGNYSPGGGGEMAPLRAYLLAKLLWDPETDMRRHLVEFTDAYYGAAAERIRDYLELTHGPVRHNDCHAYIFDNPKACYLTPEVLREGERLLDEAERLAPTDRIRLRVQVARLPVWYGMLSQRHWEGELRTQRLAEFLEIARHAGRTHISESKTLDIWAREMGAPRNP